MPPKVIVIELCMHALHFIQKHCHIVAMVTKLTSVVQLAVIRIAGIRCAFIGSASFRTVAEALLMVHQRQASLLILLAHSPAVWASREHHCHPQLYLQLLAVSQWIKNKSWAGPLQ